MSDKSDATPRAERGRFAPGISGNPSGRPRSELAALRERLETDAGAVAAVVIREALAGDMGAARLVLERILPPLKSAAASVHVPIGDASGPQAMAEAILRATLEGHLPPDTAAQLVSAAGQLCRITEVEELRGRLEALERATAPPKVNKRGRQP